ncbi:MAG: PilZ domain-containing protein [Spirochaetaceae bacterium]|nr:PilZ domain-containing protein [Spirochaetaceae bacterium]
MYFLQSISEFEIKTSPLNVAGFVAVFILLAALIIYMNSSERIKKNAVFRGKGVDFKLKERVRFDANFYSQVKYLGFTKRETSVLEKILTINGEAPSVVFHDAGKVDEYFRQSYNKIVRDNDPDNIQQELLELFSIKNAVEYFHAFKKPQTEKAVVRGFRRKVLDAPCVVYKVIVKSPDGKSKGKKTLSVQNDAAYPGKIINVSQGGCSVSMIQNIKTGILIKIDFKIGREPVIALGEILRANKEGANWVYHIKFLKLSKKSLITLNAFVFDYR